MKTFGIHNKVYGTISELADIHQLGGAQPVWKVYPKLAFLLHATLLSRIWCGIDCRVLTDGDSKEIGGDITTDQWMISMSMEILNVYSGPKES